MAKPSAHRSIRNTLREIVGELTDLDDSLEHAVGDFEGVESGNDVAAAKTAVDRATGAIRGALEPGTAREDTEVLTRAWHAIAQAQDCIREARDLVVRARAARERTQQMQRDTLAQRERVRHGE
jgi:hypothetical protein